jgi:hypothetical protein
MQNLQCCSVDELYRIDSELNRVIIKPITASPHPLHQHFFLLCEAT